jgi:hypothetical protein
LSFYIQSANKAIVYLHFIDIEAHVEPGGMQKEKVNSNYRSMNTAGFDPATNSLKGQD